MVINTVGSLISSVLKHDKKQNTYKIALFRAINDVVFSYPNLIEEPGNLAIPLRNLAKYWVAYYWPFCLPGQSILQGQRRSVQDGGLAQDMAFREQLEALVEKWENQLVKSSHPSDGFLLINELSRSSADHKFPPALQEQFTATIRKIKESLHQPIKYSGAGHWEIFEKPTRLPDLDRGTLTVVPGADNRQSCLVIDRSLWKEFHKLSMWVEALSIHEWCLFTEELQPEKGEQVSRGEVYELLTDRPDNRRPLTWERNCVELMMAGGHEFTCPWSKQEISPDNGFEIDHIIPLAVYPTNELWNLVPTKGDANQKKGEKVPSRQRLEQAESELQDTYRNYLQFDRTEEVLLDDAQNRFLIDSKDLKKDVSQLTRESITFADHIGEMRNLERY